MTTARERVREAHRLARWDEIEDVRHDATRDALVFILESGEEWALAERFAGTSNAMLAKSASAILTDLGTGSTLELGSLGVSIPEAEIYEKWDLLPADA